MGRACDLVLTVQHGLLDLPPAPSRPRQSPRAAVRPGDPVAVVGFAHRTHVLAGAAAAEPVGGKSRALSALSVEQSDAPRQASPTSPGRHGSPTTSPCSRVFSEHHAFPRKTTATSPGPAPASPHVLTGVVLDAATGCDPGVTSSLLSGRKSGSWWLWRWCWWLSWL